MKQRFENNALLYPAEVWYFISATIIIYQTSAAKIWNLFSIPLEKCWTEQTCAHEEDQWNMKESNPL